MRFLYVNKDETYSSTGELPCVDPYLISNAVGMLYRFRDIPVEKLSEAVDHVRKPLKTHINRYRRKTNPLSVNEPDKLIDDICSCAANLLKAGDSECAFAVNKSCKLTNDFWFQEKWLSNVKLMIPKEEKDVMKILPFLLTCYTENAPNNNKLDPFVYHTTSDQVDKPDRLIPVFDQDEESTQDEKSEWASPGWYDIFPDYLPAHKERRFSWESNVEKNTANLVRYFTTFPWCREKTDSKRESPLRGRPECYPLLVLEGLVDASKNAQERTNLEKRKEELLKVIEEQLNASCHAQKKKNLKDLKKELLRMIIDWELYRRFAAFCEACNEYQEKTNMFQSNLTLSMALFSRAWTFDGGKLEAFFKKKKQKQLTRPVTWDDIENDALRSEILEIVRMKDSDCVDIHNIVFGRKEWVLCNLYNMEPLVFS